MSKEITNKSITGKGNFFGSLPTIQPMLIMLNASVLRKGRIASPQGTHEGAVGLSDASRRRKIRHPLVGVKQYKGGMMKRIAGLLFALMGILAVADHARADWGSAHYGGYQPWWN